MASESEQLEREVEDARLRLRATVDELRDRLRPRAVIDQIFESARGGPVGDVLRDVRREVRNNPLPLVVIGIGVAWLLISANRSSRAKVVDAADAVAKKAHEASALAGDIAGLTREAAARLAGRVKGATARLGERAEDVSAFAATVVDKDPWPLTPTAEGRHPPEEPDGSGRQVVDPAPTE